MSKKPSLLAAAIAKEDAPAPAVNVPAKAANKADKGEKRPYTRADESGVTPSTAPDYVRPSRRDKTARTFTLLPAYWETLAELSFRSRDERGKRISQERLVAEALNDLFAKHNFPQVREN